MIPWIVCYMASMHVAANDWIEEQKEGSIRITWQLTPCTLRLIDHTELTITIEHQPGDRILWPKRILQDSSQLWWSSKILKSEKLLQGEKRTYQLSPYGSGVAVPLALQEIQVQLKDRVGAWSFVPKTTADIIVTTRFEVVDVNLLPQPMGLESPAELVKSFYWIYYVSGCTLLAILILCYVRRRKKIQPLPWTDWKLSLLFEYILSAEPTAERIDWYRQELRDYLSAQIGQPIEQQTTAELFLQDWDPIPYRVIHLLHILDTIRFGHVPFARITIPIESLLTDLMNPKIRETSESIPITQSREAR